jgi:hypothetical protein
MKTTISYFASLIEHEYGPETAAQFRQQFTQSSGDIKFSEAMEVLDRVLGCGPSPNFGATTSIPQPGVLIIEP